MAASKTEQPTQKRKEEARKRGPVAHSREVDTAILLPAAFAVFRFGGGAMWASLPGLVRASLMLLNLDPGPDPVQGGLAGGWTPRPDYRYSEVMAVPWVT